MEKKTKSLKFLRQRKMMLVLPVLVIPFLALGFHAMGGGKGTPGSGTDAAKGLNVDLPAIKDQATALDKLGLYAQAEKDSLERIKNRKNDPYSNGAFEGEDLPGEQVPGFSGSASSLGSGPKSFTDPNEQKIYEKLSVLKASLAEKSTPVDAAESSPIPQTPSVNSKDVDRLEQMMQMMQSGSGEPDPEMTEINTTLERILDIQHPERIREKLRASSEEHKGQVYAVSPFQEEVTINFLENKSVRDYAKEADSSAQLQPDGFWGLEESTQIYQDQNAIEAVIHESQTLTSGSTVKLRLMSDVFVSGQKVPAGSFLYGTAALRGERLEIEVPGIRLGSSLFPVQLSVYDMDGLSGIRIPGAITRDVAKQSGDQALGSLGSGIYDPSLGAQAASAGIQLGKSLLSKKIKLVRVAVKAGYRILLVDEKQKH